LCSWIVVYGFLKSFVALAALIMTQLFLKLHALTSTNFQYHITAASLEIVVMS
jgi:hypothetical protein